jgi:hypothetical protein
MKPEYPSPLKAIRQHCLACCLDQPQEVRLCGAVNCNSYPLSMGKSVAGIRPLTVIKNHCAECSGDERALFCELDHCPLHPFRLGKNPNRKGLGGNPANLTRKNPTESAIQIRTTCGAGVCTCATTCAVCACLDGRKS